MLGKKSITANVALMSLGSCFLPLIISIISCFFSRNFNLICKICFQKSIFTDQRPNRSSLSNSRVQGLMNIHEHLCSLIIFNTLQPSKQSFSMLIASTIQGWRLFFRKLPVGIIQVSFVSCILKRQKSVTKRDQTNIWSSVYKVIINCVDGR